MKQVMAEGNEVRVPTGVFIVLFLPSYALTSSFWKMGSIV